jgi:PadR family transcriptional regulator PadR
MNYHDQIYQAFWQGLVRLMILHQASQGPIYGGKLSKFLREQGYAISPGSLYPLLHLLEKAGFLASHLKVYRGRVRKYYEITPQGQACLDLVRREVRDLAKEVILGEDTAPDLSPAVPSLPKIEDAD